MGSVLYGALDKSYPVMVKGEGIYLYDKDGNKYIDASGGAVCVGIGHGVKEVVEAIISQVQRISFVYGEQFTNGQGSYLPMRSSIIWIIDSRRYSSFPEVPRQQKLL